MAIKKKDDAEFFNSLVPNPSGKWEYDWSVENWGTKWDASIYDYSFEKDENRLRLNFDTAWSPPITFYEKLCAMGFEVLAYYREEGMAFAGIFDNGSDDFYEYGNLSADEIEEELPQELNEMYGISDYQREWEEENQEDDEELGEYTQEDIEQVLDELKKEYDKLTAEEEVSPTASWPFPQSKKDE